jgi:hypothetical protein
VSVTWMHFPASVTAAPSVCNSHLGQSQHHRNTRKMKPYVWSLLDLGVDSSRLTLATKRLFPRATGFCNHAHDECPTTPRVLSGISEAQCHHPRTGPCSQRMNGESVRYRINESTGNAILVRSPPYSVLSYLAPSPIEMSVEPAPIQKCPLSNSIHTGSVVRVRTLNSTHYAIISSVNLSLTEKKTRSRKLRHLNIR